MTEIELTPGDEKLLAELMEHLKEDDPSIAIGVALEVALYNWSDTPTTYSNYMKAAEAERRA